MIRAPHRAVAWTPAGGWLYSPDDVPILVEDGDLVIVVSDDGVIRGVTNHDRAPLSAMLRIDGDVSQLVERIADLEQPISELKARVDALVARVDRLSGGRR